MKFLKTILKNFKILFRLKTSLIAIILGPLFIILIVGLAFNSSSSFDVVIGYHSPDNSSLTAEFVEILGTSNALKEFDSKEACASDLEQGLLHICIDFPEDFILEDGKQNNITFVVDKARINLVYSVIENVSDRVGIKTEELSMGLTDALTKTLTSTSATIDENLGSLIKVKKAISDSSNDANTINQNVGSMDLDMVSVSVNFESDADTLLARTRSLDDEIQSISDAGLALIVDIKAESPTDNITSLLNTLKANFEDLKAEGTSKHSSANNTVNSLKDKITKANTDLGTLETKLGTARTLSAENQKKITSLRSNLNSIASDIDTIKHSLEEAAQKINNIKITSSDQIVNPITTNIETVSSDTNKLTILFPYVLMLIVMFVGLLLSSTLVVVEKKNKAAFRVFTTPTRNEFYILTTFFTAFIIVILQLIVILVVASYFFIDLISANLMTNSIILILASSLFVMMGMAIGYLMSNQQGTNMASISLGAIFLFISNMVLPIESVSGYMQNFVQYNPYVLVSETLRKSILFSAGFDTIGREILILLGYSLIIVVLIILFQKVSKNMFFRHIPHLRAKKQEHLSQKTILKGELIETEKEFINLVRNITEKEHVQFIKKNKEAKQFIEHTMKKPILAKQLKKLSQKDLLKSIAHANKDIITSLKDKEKIKDATQPLKNNSREKRIKQK